MEEIDLIYEKYKYAKYLYYKHKDNSISFGKVEHFELGESLIFKNDKTLKITLSEQIHLYIIETDKSQDYIFAESKRENLHYCFSPKINPDVQIITKEQYEKLYEEFEKLKLAFNLSNFEI